LGVNQFYSDLANLWNNLVTFMAGLIFVVVFTQATLQQEKARREVERLAQELEEANQRLRQYAVQAEELATTRERNRLAREIHDGLGHYLTTIFMQVQAAQAVMETDRDRASAALEKAMGLAQAALVHVRQSVASLRAFPEIGRSLPEAIEGLLVDCRGGGLQADLQIDGQPRPLSPSVMLTCYRTVQEGLNNVRKHSRATRVTIRLDYTHPGGIHLAVEDSGGPTNEAEQAAMEDSGGDPESGGGYGLLGVRERVHLLGGEMKAAPSDGGGFILSIEVPDEAYSHSTG
jgi:signal transduction histidine kinase